MGEEKATEMSTVAEPDEGNGTSPVEVSQHLDVYDFSKMSAVDWDKVYKGHMNQLLYTSWNGLNIARLTLCIWIFASHLALVVFILAKSRLRSQPKNLLIINVSLTNVLLGVFLVPAKLHFILAPVATDCQLSVAWTMLNEYFQVCVSMLAVFGLVMERLVYVFTARRGMTLRRLATWTNCALYFLLPWAVAALLVLPVFYEALVERVQDETCAWRVRDNYFLILQILSFVPAATAVFFTAPLAGLWDCLRSRECHYTPSTPRGESLAIAVLVSVLAVFCETPYFVVRMIIMCMECNHPHCQRFNEGLTDGMWVRIAKAAVMPFIWLVYSDIRDAMLCRLHYKKVKNESAADEDDYRLMNTQM
ncbi:hypothetical protein BaRGS_00028758 [Batillaria attramentaria]|uniref:G-protein coupled receptors family 1 profile domain-containing protein n=1 Tax=Batillaria attramentaria TaxID=370345 RepID=A0ABD0JZK8_9CAEN|nr:hypothetical protein BaRGS_035206 [Batillaria attramentaria]